MSGRGLAALVFFTLWVYPGSSPAGVESQPLSPHPVTHTISGVPFFSEATLRYAPASLAGVMSYWGKEVNIDDFLGFKNLSAIFKSPPDEPEESAWNQGLSVWTYRGSLADLRNHISLNHPVVVFLNEKSRVFPDGQFIVVTGFNDRDREIFAHSVSEPNKVVAYDRFVERWAKADFWTLLILPKDIEKAP